MNKQKFFKISDLIIVAVCVLVAVVFLLLQTGDAQKAVIVADGKIHSEIVLANSTNQAVTVNGVTIKIEGKTVMVENSNCPDKICVKTGKLTKSGQSTACVPNRVTVFITGKSDIDIITY